jgi:SEC-C motif-containing protein
MQKTCPCSSGKAYEECCALFHKGENPKSPLQLMRSRYSAYALNLPDYIIATTHAKSPHWEKNLELWKHHLAAFAQNTLFLGLDILEVSEKGDKGTVTFKAHLSQGGKEVSFTEKSRFEKVVGKWLYLDGEIIPK